MAIPNSNQLYEQKQSIFDQLKQSSAPVTQNEALRYLQQGVNNFAPLQAERRAVQTQANDILPSQIIDYFAQKTANPNSGVDSFTNLRNIIANQNRLMGTSNLIGDQIDTAKGRLGNISQDALSMLGQNNANLQRQYDMVNQDYGMQLQREEAERARAEARRAAAAQQAAMYGAYGQQSGGGYGAGNAGGSLTITDAPTPGIFNGNEFAKQIAGNVGSTAKKAIRQTNDVFNQIDPNAKFRSAVSNIAKPSNDFLNNLLGGNLYKGLGKLGIM